MSERTNTTTTKMANTATPNPTSKSNWKTPNDLTLSNDFLDPLRMEFFSDASRFQVTTTIDDTPNPRSSLKKPTSKDAENAIDRSESLRNSQMTPIHFTNSSPANALQPPRTDAPGITHNEPSKDLEIREFVRSLIPPRIAKHSKAIVPLINCSSSSAGFRALNGKAVRNALAKNAAVEGLLTSQPMSPSGHTILPNAPPKILGVEPLTPPQSVPSTTIDNRDALETEETSQTELTILNSDVIRSNCVSSPQAIADGTLKPFMPQQAAPSSSKGKEKPVDYGQTSESEVEAPGKDITSFKPASTRSHSSRLRYDGLEFVPSLSAAIVDAQPLTFDQQPYKEDRPSLLWRQSWLVKLDERRKQRQLELGKRYQLELEKQIMRPTKKLVEKMVEFLYDDEPSESAGRGLEMSPRAIYEPGEASGPANTRIVNFPSMCLPPTVTHNPQGCSRWLSGLICSENSSRAFRMINNFPWPQEMPHDVSTCRPSSNVVDDDTMSVATNDYGDEEQGMSPYLPTTQKLPVVSNDTEPVNSGSFRMAEKRYERQHRENSSRSPTSVPPSNQVNSAQSGQLTTATQKFRAVPTGTSNIVRQQRQEQNAKRTAAAHYDSRAKHSGLFSAGERIILRNPQPESALSHISSAQESPQPRQPDTGTRSSRPNNPAPRTGVSWQQIAPPRPARPGALRPSRSGTGAQQSTQLGTRPIDPVAASPPTGHRARNINRSWRRCVK